MSMEIKQQLLDACLEYVQERITRIEAAIKDLEAALKLETKCSMGDKYETGRAMLHLEFEKLSGQHEEYRKLRKTLRMIEPKKRFEAAGFGGVVKTSGVNYFIAIPAGEITLEGEKFYAIGGNAPIARALTGKKQGEEVLFNGRKFLIKEVF
jgi:transcription elongation GreA/GreB family factor